jgi:hypothetical protein
MIQRGNILQRRSKLSGVLNKTSPRTNQNILIRNERIKIEHRNCKTTIFLCPFFYQREHKLCKDFTKK